MSTESSAKGAGTRRTRQRDAVIAALDAAPTFVSARELHEALRAQGTHIGLATVYRNLALLVDVGELDTLQRPDGEMLYRRCSPHHHHHLVCRQCGRTVEVAGPTVERWASAVAADHGYADVTHRLELTGVCPQCLPGSPAAPPRSGR
mgnify:CR=1 FL=1